MSYSSYGIVEKNIFNDKKNAQNAFFNFLRDYRANRIKRGYNDPGSVTIQKAVKEWRHMPSNKKHKYAVHRHNSVHSYAMRRRQVNKMLETLEKAAGRDDILDEHERQRIIKYVKKLKASITLEEFNYRNE